jgi:CheY-like chemotaxis protein
MKRILIADASKASLVMTSEVFKDNFPGVQVVVARTSAECLELVKTSENIDAYIIDFDLPDRDGACTAARIKKLTQTPVLITAFDRPDVHDVIEEELAAYDDCLNWLRKPVKAETVVAVAQRYCEGKYRTQRRLISDIPALAEVVITTTITRTVKETIKTFAPAAKGKAVASKAPVGKTAAKLPVATSKVITRTVSEKIHSKAGSSQDLGHEPGRHQAGD